MTGRRHVHAHKGVHIREDPCPPPAAIRGVVQGLTQDANRAPLPSAERPRCRATLGPGPRSRTPPTLLSVRPGCRRRPLLSHLHSRLPPTPHVELQAQHSPGGLGARQPEVLVSLVGRAQRLWPVLTLQTSRHSVGHSGGEGWHCRGCVGTLCPLLLQGASEWPPCRVRTCTPGSQVPLLGPLPQF